MRRLFAQLQTYVVFIFTKIYKSYLLDDVQFCFFE